MKGGYYENKREYIKTIFDHNQGLIELADNKASIILGINSILIPLIFGVTSINFMNLVNNGLLMHSFILNTFSIIGFSFLVISFIFSILVIKARLSEELENYIFFKNIVRQEFEEYKNKIFKLNEEEILDDCLKEIYALAKINEIKYKRYKWTLWMLIFGIGSLFIGYFLIAIVNYYIIYNPQ